MNPRLFRALLLLVSFFPGVSLAGAGEVHVHGRAMLQLVQENNRVEISLRVPAMDVVGFEHAPRTNAQISAIREAALTLGEVTAVIEPPASAGCSQQWSTVRSELMDMLDVETLSGNGGASESAGHHDHDQHRGHDHAHDQHTDDEHDHHSEFEAEWHLACANPEAFNDLEVRLFDTLPSLRNLVVQAVTDDGQYETRLARGDTRVRLE